MEIKKDAYGAYVKEVTPLNNVWADMGKAFLVGGLICLVGQILTNWLMNGMGMEKETASAWTSIVLIGTSILLTGLNWYPKLVKFGGAGALVPITGFANSVVAPAIEYKTEGQVFGIGCKIFTIAGPVILYGVLASWVLGVVYWVGQAIGML
ncbi:MAG: SpoVA/SpoVAEb family sporulation membrane protein [Lachnospiraceae bacterium]|nr:SpoVA/SpoVAEb family sporulation membrane protein [Lachnospiraceae bacterium]